MSGQRERVRRAWVSVVGLGIASARVSAVGLNGERLVWVRERARGDSESLAETIRALLAECPPSRWPRPKVMVAVGPASVQVKRLAGLPPLTDAAALAALVRENAGRFFLKNGVPLVTSGVRLMEPGVAWGAAFDESVMQAIAQGCRAARLQVRAVVPTIVALGGALTEPDVLWQDGEVQVALTFAAGRIATLRRVPSVDATVPPTLPTPVPPLAALGAERALAFADAYGAARTPQGEPLVVRPQRGTDNRGSVARGRHASAALALLLAAVLALFAPGLVATRATRAATRRLVALQVADAKARATERELVRVSASLGELSAFGASHRSATRLLAQLTRALPEEAALVSLQLDTTSGTLVALATRAALVVDAVERLSDFAAPEIVGPVTKERVGARELERVTVRFRLLPPREFP